MKFAPLTLVAAAALTATSAFASGDIASVDQNGDHFASYSEITSVYPGLTRNDFRDIDTNRDQRVSANELTAPDAQSIVKRQLPGHGDVLDLAAVDTNGDNFVSFSELAGAYSGLSAIDFDLIDLSNDNRLDANELYSPATQVVVSRFENGDNGVVSLNSVDLDGSGFVTFDEVSGSLPGLTNVDFDDIDLNNDNRLSVQELYDLDARTILSQSAS